MPPGHQQTIETVTRVVSTCVRLRTHRQIAARGFSSAAPRLRDASSDNAIWGYDGPRYARAVSAICHSCQSRSNLQKSVQALTIENVEKLGRRAARPLVADLPLS